jgi:hypothetical protein
MAMARIVISSDEGHVTHSERVLPSDLDSEHFRRCLIERVQWAVKDAHPRADCVTAVRRSRSRERRPRAVSVAAVRDAAHKLAGTPGSRQLVAAS